MHDTLIPLAVFIIGVVVIQQFNRKAIRHLNVEEKARLLDCSMGISKWRFIPLLVIILGYEFYKYSQPSPDHRLLALYAFVGLIILSSAVCNAIVIRKFQAIGLPKPYIQTTAACSIATVLWMLGFIVWLLLPIYKIHEAQ